MKGDKPLVELIPAALIAFIPGLLWVWYFYKKDIHEPEPKIYIIKVFILGAISVLPAAAMERAILYLYPNRQMPTDLFSLLLFTIFVVGLVEEFWKYAAVRYTVYNTREFDEHPMDGLIYAVAAGLGFAAMENLFYTTSFGYGTGLVRAVVTTLAHASFSGIVGYNLGLAKMNPQRETYFIVRGLILASILHGIYNFIFLSRILPVVGTVPIFILIVWQLFRRFKSAQERSPFRLENRDREET